MVKRLTRYMRVAGAYSGAYVVDLSGDRPRAIFRWRQQTAAHPGLEHEALHHNRGAGPLRHARARSARRCSARASSTPRASSAAASTCAAAATRPSAAAASRTRSYGGGATVQDLAALLEDAGIERVTGRVYGDESAFDSLRGGPDSGYGVSHLGRPAERPLLQPRPVHRERPRLPGEPAGVRGRSPRRRPRGARRPGAAEAARRAHAGAARRVLASVDSPPMERLIRLTNKPSDNFFAETLLKDLAHLAGGVGHHRRAARGSRRRTRAGWARAPRSSTAPASRAATAPRR